MNEYSPDAWVIVKVVNDSEVTYKVFAQWYGGYARGDSWKINSGIVSVEMDGNFYLFKGYSGAVYRCHKEQYRTTGYGYSVLRGFMVEAETHPSIKLEVMDDCDWMVFDFNGGAAE